MSPIAINKTPAFTHQSSVQQPIQSPKIAATAQTITQQGKKPSSADHAMSLPPPLPDVKGPFAKPHELQKVIPLLKSHQASFGSTMSEAMIFSLIFKILQELNQATGGFKRSANKIQNAQQLKAAELGKTKVEGDRRAAFSNLMWALAGGGAACALTGGGYAMQSTPNRMAVGQAMLSLGSAANSVSTNIGRYVDTTFAFGGQHKADEAQTEKQHADFLASLFGSQHETFKDANSQVMQHVQELISQLRNMASNKHEVASTIARNIG